MKKVRRNFLVMLLLFAASIQFVNAQSLESQMQSFFSSNNNLPYRTICRLAHPTNTFVKGSLYMSGDNVYVTIESEDYIHKVRIHKSGNRFDAIEVISDNDWFPPYVASNIVKTLANDYYRDYHSSTIAMVEEIYGERLRDMDAKKMCLAALTLQLWKY